MGFASNSGYTPNSIADLMQTVMTNINAQFGTSYTTETFVGTNFYKYFYALIQKLQANEVKTSEIFLKLQDYFRTTNERISRPVVTSPGVISALESAGYVASVKPMIDADAGKIYIAVDKAVASGNWEDGGASYTTDKAAVNAIIKDSISAGIVSQGTETTAITLSNGQSFTFKYNLPNRITTYLKLTTVLSVNNQVLVGDPDVTKQNLVDNIKAAYGLGKNFEPNRYFSVEKDAPWASSVLLEWSTDGGSTYHSTVYSAAYNDLYMINLARVTLVET